MALNGLWTFEPLEQVQQRMNFVQVVKKTNILMIIRHQTKCQRAEVIELIV